MYVYIKSLIFLRIPIHFAPLEEEMHGVQARALEEAGAQQDAPSMVLHCGHGR